MQPKHRRLVTEQNLESYTHSEIQGVRNELHGTNTRLTHLETVGGLAPGEVTDSQTANLIQQPSTSTRAALDSTYLPNSVLNLAPQPPPGFRGLHHLPTPRIRRSMAAEFTAEVDVSVLRPPAGVTYYTDPTASSLRDQTNTGLTPDSPLTVAAILQRSDVGTIMFAPGEYSRTIANGGASMPGRSLNLIASGPGVRLTGWNAPTDTTWTQTTGHIYQTNRSATYSVVDVENLTAWGDFSVYTQRDTLASIDGPGQWAIDGAVVYVWALGDTDLSIASNRDQIRLQVQAQTGAPSSGPDVVKYVEGIDFWGASSGTSSNYDGGLIAYSGATIIAKDCTSKYNMDDGVRTKGGHFIGINVEASSNGRDGFNYHDTQNIGGEFIEIACHAHHNGLKISVGSNNGSSAHEAVTGIRVSGIYEEVAGPVVADVNSAQTWNLGCYSGGSAVAIHYSQDSSWRTDTATPEDPAIQWLDECSSGDAQNAYRTSGDGATIFVHASGYANEHEQWPDSNVRNYQRR